MHVFSATHSFLKFNVSTLASKLCRFRVEIEQDRFRQSVPRRNHFFCKKKITTQIVGSPSLQNVIEVRRAALQNSPTIILCQHSSLSCFILHTVVRRMRNVHTIKIRGSIALSPQFVLRVGTSASFKELTILFYIFLFSLFLISTT